MQVWFNRRYSVVCHKMTSCGIPLYRLVDNYTEDDDGFGVTIDKGYGDKEHERLRQKCNELNKEA